MRYDRATIEVTNTVPRIMKLRMSSPWKGNILAGSLYKFKTPVDRASNQGFE